MTTDTMTVTEREAACAGAFEAAVDHGGAVRAAVTWTEGDVAGVSVDMVDGRRAFAQVYVDEAETGWAISFEFITRRVSMTTGIFDAAEIKAAGLMARTLLEASLPTQRVARSGIHAGQTVSEPLLTAGTVNLIVHLLNKIGATVPTEEAA